MIMIFQIRDSDRCSFDGDGDRSRFNDVDGNDDLRVYYLT